MWFYFLTSSGALEAIIGVENIRSDIGTHNTANKYCSESKMVTGKASVRTNSQFVFERGQKRGR